MIERLVARLSYSPLRAVARIFSGTPKLYLESDPAVQRALIASSERKVYGAEGLDGFERRETRPVSRAARRSLAQHLGQRAQYPRAGDRAARWTAFAALTPFLFAYQVYDTLRSRGLLRRAPAAGDVVVFFWADRLDKFVWPRMFGDRTVTLHRTQQSYLGFAELAFLLRVFAATPRALLYPEFVSNLLRWIGYYGFVRRYYRPGTVAHFFESTAASSVVTAYLNQHGIEHCDIQHGEMRLNAHCAFASFDRYRVWGKHTQDLFAAQRSPHERVEIVGVPPHRDLFERVRPSNQPRGKRVLLLDNFQLEEWDHDADFLRVLHALDASWEVRVRRHPANQQPRLPDVDRWNAHPETRRRGIVVTEERPSEVSLADALSRSRVVVGVSSAALLEAWLAGCKVLYVPGGPVRDAVMARHQDSPNVAHLGDHVDLAAFLSEPATLDADEAKRVHHVSAVLG